MDTGRILPILILSCMENGFVYWNAGSKSEKNGLKAIKKFQGIQIPNYLFKNNGDLTFQRCCRNWGLDDEALFQWCGLWRSG